MSSVRLLEMLGAELLVVSRLIFSCLNFDQTMFGTNELREIH